MRFYLTSRNKKYSIGLTDEELALFINQWYLGTSFEAMMFFVYKKNINIITNTRIRLFFTIAAKFDLDDTNYAIHMPHLMKECDKGKELIQDFLEHYFAAINYEESDDYKYRTDYDGERIMTTEYAHDSMMMKILKERRERNAKMKQAKQRLKQAKRDKIRSDEESFREPLASVVL